MHTECTDKKKSIGVCVYVCMHACVCACVCVCCITCMYFLCTYIRICMCVCYIINFLMIAGLISKKQQLECNQRQLQEKIGHPVTGIIICNCHRV